MSNLFFKTDHWTMLTLAEAAEWEMIAPNFLPKELASKGDGSLVIQKEALSKLQRLRHLHGKALSISSGYRDPVHNKRVGGSPVSQHVEGVAFDIPISDADMGEHLERLAVEVGFSAVGRYNTFIHVDNRPPKSNGKLYLWGLASWD
tara:strand:- start:453 stop:893 length:441 start_codon:yes stop_codon:yes gene_type:complete